MTKISLRQRLLLERRNLPADEYRRYSAQAQLKLSSLSCFTAARTVAIYSPVMGEVDTGALFMSAQEAGKRIFFPKVCGQDMQFFEVTALSDLTIGAFGVLEPSGRGSVSSVDFDLMVVPGVAFDLRGHRLGYGKGYYDRWLAGNCPKVKVGLAFDLQIVGKLPAEQHDQYLDFIATETRLIPCHNGVAGSI